MTKFLFAFASVLLMPAISQASLVNPASREGRTIVHQAATQISNEFVAQTDLLQGKEADNADCENVRTKVLERLSSLDLSHANELKAAKTALESAACESNDRKNVSDKLFAATLSIRSFENSN